MENKEDNSSGEGIYNQIKNNVIDFNYALSIKDFEKVLKNLKYNNEITD